MTPQSGGRGALSTGIKQIDALLAGGIPANERVLVYGPSFQGKEVLAKQAALANLQKGVPAVLMLTNAASQDVREQMLAMDPQVPAYEKDGLLWFVDAYSRQVGLKDNVTNVAYVDSPVDTNGLSLALNRVHSHVIKKGPVHLLVIDSASTLVLYSNAQATFRFLQVLVGRARQAGAASLVLLDQGMHSDAEVQMFKHLVDGCIEMRTSNDRTQLSVEGLGLQKNPGWLDYTLQGDRVEVTGSLAAGRIH